MQQNSKHLLDFVFEIGLSFVKLVPENLKIATMEFWKFLCLFCSY